MRRRVLLVAPASSYRLDDFRAAAARLTEELELLIATDRCPVLAELWGDAGRNRDVRRSVPIDLGEPQRAAAALAAFHGELRHSDGRGFVGALGVDETSALVASLVAAECGLRASAPRAAAAARDKLHQRTQLSAAGLPVPRFAPLAENADAGEVAASVGFPCVLKPRGLSSSRGVIRADDAAAARRAAERIRRLLARPDLGKPFESGQAVLLAERFIPGAEVAVEGLMRGGRFELLAVFDKPDPLDGPFFEETLYVTPSRLPEGSRQALADCAARAAAALGLSEGPVHSELRLNAQGPWILEVAARSIGGLCSRTLRFGLGLSLEELLLRHAAGLDIPTLERSGGASGVMMLPIPAAGTLHSVAGVDEARALPAIEDVVISVRPGERLVPLPEGNRYLGFAFARAADPATVEAALRRAHALLRFEIGPDLPRA
ncbi:MAG: ATP-grasp domain-containing protein [Myxococcales bacterium]